MKSLIKYLIETQEKYEEITEKEAREKHKRYGIEICLLSSDYDINNEIHRETMGFIGKNDDFDDSLRIFKRYECHGDIKPKFYIEKYSY